MRIKLNSSSGWKVWCGSLILGFILSLALMPVPFGYCDDVDVQTARLVAYSTLQRHVAIYGDWNGISTPTVSSVRAVNFNGTAVAYNFQIAPSGHVLVAIDNYLSPVLLYSTTSTFVPERAQQPNAIESWILPEVKHQVEAVKAYRQSGAIRSSAATASDAARRIADAWSAYTTGGTAGSMRSVVTASADKTSDERPDQARTAVVGPLLTTTWGQDDPYNYLSPADGCAGGENTLTGCVATAWAQLLNYWSWPIQGSGISDAYDWNSATQGTVEMVGVDFNVTYQWDLMLDDYSSGYTNEQRDAVAQLMYHMGVAARMQFGCTGSGSSAWADDVLDVYFGYQSSMEYHDRTLDGYSGSTWFDLIRAELDADPPRPVVFSIFATIGGGHEVIIDGYQTYPDSLTDMVHINFGWLGYEDGFYNITYDFTAGGYTWDANDQYVITGIEPDNDPPVVDAGSNQTVGEGASVQLDGSATDPEGIGISYLWTQTSGPSVTLSSAAAEDPTFSAPNVHGTTNLVFQLRADDANRAYATDNCTITINNTDGSTAPTVEAGSDQTVEETDTVQLSGSATDPNGDGISSYMWTQISGINVTLSNAASATATFTAPNFHNISTTTLVFRFRANYNNGDSALDTCSIIVNNTDGSTTGAGVEDDPPSYHNDSTGGGCFISHLD